MMTRKDYIAVSEILGDYQEVMDRDEYFSICLDFAKYMSKDNDRFDMKRFMEACGVSIPETAYPPKSALSHVALA
jgi:hypothetical protein